MQTETVDEKFNWLAIKFVAIISLVFLFQAISPQSFEKFTLKSSDVILHPWTLVTYIFLHGSFSHLFSNMFALAIFGSMLEKVIGYKNFLKIFFSTGIFSGILSTFFYNSVIGASGAVFGIMGVLAMLRPKIVVWAMGVPMYMIAAIAVYATLDIVGIFYPSNIANIGHLSALSAGILIGLVWRGKYKVVERRREKSVLSEEELRRWEEKYMKRKLNKRAN